MEQTNAGSKISDGNTWKKSEGGGRSENVNISDFLKKGSLHSR